MQADSVEIAAIEVWCETCYIRGIASASLKTSGDLIEAVGDTVDKVVDEIGDTIDEIAQYVGDVIETAKDEIFDGNFDVDSWNVPPLNISFDVNVPPMPEYVLEFGFDELEVYAGFQTVISAGVTYQINLWRSGPKALAEELKWEIDSSIDIDVGLSVDLIISVDQEVSISNGFHLKLEDGVQFKIALFSKEVSDVTL